ncbi:hypothetical protein 22 [Lunatimonas lonarensis]|uniref:Beta-D-galactosidase n=1 Tax=Lunatimonas lonarensis TaxID=1232681 RepID=R7ZZ47_9BACT|nr:YhcH/YjgK/YiaL family protein [Lunatimonas lonarensis]EON79329.1 hypothetical protein 22 [Lunatimonas lonarensis]
MIIDSLANAARYYSVHPLFQEAFEHIQKQDLNNLAPGKSDISSDRLKSIVFVDAPLKTEAESLAKFECHDKNIDIQLCVSGLETIGWKPRESCTQLKGEYNPEKDVSYYADQPDMYFQLGAGQFAILFPEDVHAPMIGEGVVSKLVIKVKQ